MTKFNLSELLKEFLIYPLEKPIDVHGLALDSRLVKKGDLFFASPGTQVDGRQFIDAAIQQGAVAVLSEGTNGIEYRQHVPIISLPNLAHKVGLIAAKFYHDPSYKMQIVGITGTNGKTSCSHFIAQALHELHSSCGVIGTLGNGIYGRIKSGSLTTPDPISLQKTLAEYVYEGAKYTAMEVSSHSIEQGRVSGIDFAISIFTNLTRDHLDYHGTMENYGNAKKKLFESSATHLSVINADDAFGIKIISELHREKQIYAFGINAREFPANVPFIHAEELQLNLNGIRAHIHSPWGHGELHAKLIGKFNVSNLLAVFTTLCLLDIPFEKVLYLISKLKSVDGRMQTLGGNQKPLVVVDYAHTPDALEKVLQALRYHCEGKLYCVFGCGGDRDRGKRPIMAKIAEQFSDQVIVTDDNPRTENPEQIFKDIMTGFVHPEKVIAQHDRAKTIHDVIHQAKAGDCILIAGKGAETYQIIGTDKLPFLDSEQVELALEK